MKITKILNKAENTILKALGKGYSGHGSIIKEIKLLKSLLKNVNLAIDVGGNVGDYSIELIKFDPNIEIHIFEPALVNQDKLKNRFLKYPKIHINAQALSDSIGSAPFYSNVAGSELGSLTKRKLDHYNINFESHELVQTIRFENYWKSVLKERVIDVAKLDVEGHELNVLNGFGKAILNTKVIQFEFGGCNIDTRTYFRDFWYFFKEHSYRIYRITPFGLEYISNYSENHESFLTTNFLCVNENNHLL
jgi:FkbM family methyltransferase